MRHLDPRQCPPELSRRARMLNVWPRVAVALIIAVVILGVWMWFEAPWLVDPLWVASALERDELPKELLWVMALILPLVILTCLLLLIAMVLVAWAGFRRESDYLHFLSNRDTHGDREQQKPW